MLTNKQELAMRRTRVIVADPYPVIVLGLRKLVEDDPRLEVVAEASNMTSVWKTILARQPEVALLDWSTAAENLEITRALLQSKRHATAIVFLTVGETSPLQSDMLRFGARAFLSKWSSAEKLRAAIWKASRRAAGPHLAPLSNHGSADAAAKSVALSRPHSRDDVERRMQELTRRERQILPLIASGRKNKEIAAELGISESTVWHHLTAIFQKLQVEDRLGLAVFCLECGLSR